MNDPLPTTQIPHEPLAYQPYSGWAISGFAIGSFFTLLVALSAIVALVQGAPFFYPMWIMGLAILGMAVSLYAGRHVQSSEGTRTGAPLARWGFRLSLISALMYCSYYFVTRYTVQAQANDFVMVLKDDSGFIPRLREGAADLGRDNITQLNSAFLLTRAPNDRSARPDNEASMRANYDLPEKEGKSGQLTQFRDHALTRLFYKQLGSDAEITPQGVLDWRYEKRSYKVIRTYRIKTREIEIDFVLSVFSAEAESGGQSRKWFVNLRESGPLSGPTSKKLTPLGERVRLLRKYSSDWLTKRILSGKEGGAVPDIDKVDRTPWDLLPLQAGKLDERPALIKKYRGQLYQSLKGEGKLRVLNAEILTPADQAGKWEQEGDGKIRMLLTFRFALLTAPLEMPAYPYEAIATLESTRPIDAAKFTDDSPAPDWNLLGLEITAATTVLDRK